MQANILHNIEFKNLQMNDGTVFLALSNLNKEKLQIHSLKRIPFKENLNQLFVIKIRLLFIEGYQNNFSI